MALLQGLRPVSIRDLSGSVAATKMRLISAGEKLFGERGVDTAPLHDIAVEAGLGNKCSVQYHFENREGLIDAIFAARLPAIEQRQHDLLEQARDSDRLDDLEALLQLTFLPVAEQVDEGGRNAYARFLLQFMTRPGFDHRLIHRCNGRNKSMDFVHSRIGGLAGMQGETVIRRMYLLMLVFLGALVERDNAAAYNHPTRGLEQTLGETITMMTSAISEKIVTS